MTTLPPISGWSLCVRRVLKTSKERSFGLVWFYFLGLLFFRCVSLVPTASRTLDQDMIAVVSLSVHWNGLSVFCWWCFSKHRVFDCPGTHYVARLALTSKKIHLPSAGSKGICHHAWSWLDFLCQGCNSSIGAGVPRLCPT